MQCGACMWLIETWLRRQPDVVDASVNFAMRRARVRWHGPASALGRVLDAVSAIGYQAHVYDRRRREALLRREKRMLLLRTGVALLAMMQVMMLAIPAYIGDDTIERGQQALLDWASLVLTLPVVLFSAWPFASGAWRSVRMHRVGMDVPVAIGVAGAFLASAWAIVAGHGAVYFDSITMFVALLLVARYAELCARAKASAAIESVALEIPLTAERLTGRGPGREVETVPASGLAAGDSILVSAGGTIPADGLIVDGASSVEEALVTGESRPLRKRAGERVLAGSVNRESPLVVRVEAAGSATTLAALARMVDRAADARPRSVALADLAQDGSSRRCFASPRRRRGTGGGTIPRARSASRSPSSRSHARARFRSQRLPQRSPPAGALGRRGILAVRSGAFEVLARVTHVVLDKTGTLTVGRAHLVAVESPRGWSP
jgi:Cu2+-exporting ATPase